MASGQEDSVGSFFDRPQVQVEELPVGPGVPMGTEVVFNRAVGIGGVYGAWGETYDNVRLPQLIEAAIGKPLSDESKLNLSELGFKSRHHVPDLSDEQHVELEVAAGARLLRQAANANGWDPSEVDAVLIGVTVPACEGFTRRIAHEAGIRDSALKVTVHKACDGSVAGLNLAMNPGLAIYRQLGRNLAEELSGKKVLVGGIEGLSRVLKQALDVQALQLFATGAGVIGVVPGRTMKFLVGGTSEVYDEEGLLQVKMFYPHSRHRVAGESLIEVAEVGENDIRVAGLMHEPEAAGGAVVMAGPMGMVKLFVRSGVVAVRNVYRAYQDQMAGRGMQGKDFAVAIVHHANLKINQLKDKQLRREGICLPMPWLLSDFGNVSAASAMIAFLRKLASLSPGDHVLFDGFGAGTYYDVVAVELGG